MKTIKIGIIGAGRIGRVHAENIAKFVPEMEIKTIADPYMSEETVEFLRRLRIPNIVKDADVILNDPEIKAVVVCSPTDLHAEYAIKVAEAGKDVFVEKPVDYRIDRVKEVIAAAKNLKIVVRAGAGYDNVDLAAASARGIVVMNTPGQNSNAVAELALAMMIFMSRNRFTPGTGTELQGKTLGIHNITAFGIIHFGNAFQIITQTGKHGNRLQSVRAVTAGHKVILISQRTGHQHLLYLPFIQRKDIILVLQKHKCLLLHLLHKIHIPVCPAYSVGGFRIGYIRLVEQSQTEFHPQHFRHTLVYHSH